MMRSASRRVRWALMAFAGLTLLACGASLDSPQAAEAEEFPPLIAGPLTPDTLYLPPDATATLAGATIDRGDPGWPFGAPWATNWNVRLVELEELHFAGRRDAFPSLDDPRFDETPVGDEWLSDGDQVIQLEIGGDSRAFPLGIMTRHEIVNTTIWGQAVAVTYCPLCNSAIAFERVLYGTVVEFGVSGLLRNSDLIMWDRSMESLWQQLTGEAIVGGMVGARLVTISAPIVSSGQFKRAFPSGLVLSRGTGYPLTYEFTNYAGYDSTAPTPNCCAGRLILEQRRPIAWWRSTSTASMSHISLGICGPIP